ncbi:hypothetical protein ACFFLM_15655 [Deinococcus oregonensis]|uniref:Uncharacterized protein n=1 Tax=Deinococcus oregonensis TaxID=1805970 RepID=A0ABV6B0X4_9DEIO
MTEWLVVLPETRQVLQEHYPVAFQHAAYLRLLGHLLFSADYAEGQLGQVLLNQSVLA